MKNWKSNRTIAIIVGILILVAYSMLTYDISKNIELGAIADILSGLAVILISLLMYPLFKKENKQIINILYVTLRCIEGLLMIITGIFLLAPTFIHYRPFIYQYIHIYFFIFGALFFYFLLYTSEMLPKFISIWGTVATIILFMVTIIKLFGIENQVLNISLAPMILNELFLAFWLITKGFNKHQEV